MGHLSESAVLPVGWIPGHSQTLNCFRIRPWRFKNRIIAGGTSLIPRSMNVSCDLTFLVVRFSQNKLALMKVLPLLVVPSYSLVRKILVPASTTPPSDFVSSLFSQGKSQKSSHLISNGSIRF